MTQLGTARVQLEQLQALNKHAQAISAHLADAERYLRMASFADTDERRKHLLSKAEPLLEMAAKFWLSRNLEGKPSLPEKAVTCHPIETRSAPVRHVS